MLKIFSDKLSLILATVIFVLAISFYSYNSSSFQDICKKAEKHLAKKEKEVETALSAFDNIIGKATEFPDTLLFIKENLDKEGIILLSYRNDSLKFWSSNFAPVDIAFNALNPNNGMIHLRNGWYEYFLRSKNNFKSVALLLIKPEYDVQNSYFDNSFTNWLHLPSHSEIKSPTSDKNNIIKSSTGKELFKVDFTESELKFNGGQLNWPLLLFFTSLFVFGFGLIKLYLNKATTTLHFIFFSFALLVIRGGMIYFRFPALLYSSDLYDLHIYGITESFFNEYLGDVLLNVVVFFIWTIIFYKNFDFKLFPEKLKLLVSAIYLLILIALSLQLNSTVKNLVINSTISLDFSNFFNLSYLSFLCLGIVFINGFSITIHIEKLISFLFEKDKKKSVNFLLGSFGVFTLVYLIAFKPDYSLVEWFWLSILIAIAVVFRNYDFTQSILSAGFRILAFAIITSWIFGEYNGISEQQNFNHLTEQLSDRQDAVLESEFLKVSSQIRKDSQLLKAIKRLPLQNNETEQQMRQIYFTKYFEKYNVHLTLFDSLCMPYFKNSDYYYNNHEYFDNQMANAMPTISEELFFIDKYKRNSRYIGKIELEKQAGQKPAYTLYVQLEPKQFTDAGSFPELLLDKSQQKQKHYKDLSYAIYKNGELTSVYGKYLYPKFFSSSVITQNTNQYKHNLILPDKETQLVISSKIKTFNYYFTANSYYFLFFSLLGIVFFVCNHRLNNNSSNFFTLNRRIQFFIVSVLFLAITAVGIFTINLVIKKSEDDQTKLLTEKARQIQNELNNKLFYNQKININSKPFTENLLRQYSELFNSDISLFNENGVLFASSRPQLFNAGLSSKLINPLAILHFAKNKSLYYITRDKIGSLNYLSLYTALYDTNKNLTGYINLPYFARQNDLEEGVSDYITTLINIYVVLFLVSLFTGLIVSVYITKPLRILQQQLAKISLGKKNEPILWQSNDEIGKLVNEYNEMLLKLEESAVLLAKSEREGAWQEMAKQVAHEIKNPLTPMKLNLQYLQKVVGDETVDFEERFKKVSDSLIEQIDTLANIANEFSNFAKMPKVSAEEINLIEVINSSIELFNTKEQVDIHLTSEMNSAFIYADKNQCLRVFNNLLKNAIQAIPEDRKGKIEITVEDKAETFLVSIKDNGSGISDDMKDKIFVPNFTTKTTGTGLGLAMVKNIITSFNGDIWFESVENKGTTFYIKFQKQGIQKG